MALKIAVKNPSKKVTTKNDVKKEVTKGKEDNKAVGKYVIFDEGGYFTKYRLYASDIIIH